jgi:hypothetical protein
MDCQSNLLIVAMEYRPVELPALGLHQVQVVSLQPQHDMLLLRLRSSQD